MEILKLVVQNLVKLFLTVVIIVVTIFVGTKIYSLVQDSDPVGNEIARESQVTTTSPVKVNTVRANISTNVSRPMAQNVRVISKTGNIVAGQEVAVSPEVSAQVVKMLVREGSKVKKGDILLKLGNSTQLQNAVLSYNTALELLKNAENSLNIAAQSGRVNVSTFNEQMDLARLNIEKAAVQLESAQAIRYQQLNIQDINSATQDLQSRLPKPSNPVNDLLVGAGQGLSQLLQENGIDIPTQNQMSEAELEYLKNAIENNQNVSQFKSRELELMQGYVQDQQNFLNLQSSEVQLGLLAKQMQAAELQSQAGVNSARAQLIQIRQQVEAARITLSLGEVRSPIDGYIANLSAVVGTQVSPGQSILSVVNLEEIKVKLFLSANEVLELMQTPNSQRQVSVEVLGEAVPARIEYVGVVANNQTRTIPVEVIPVFSNATVRAKFIPNTFARVNFELESAKLSEVAADLSGAFTVPVSALVMNSNDFKLAVVENGVVRFRDIEAAAGIASGRLVINSGIRNGDEVILNPNGLNEGDKVTTS